MTINLKVLDISHHNEGPGGNGAGIDFVAIHDFGVRGIIHKGTQGVGYVDPMLAARRQAILDAGLLFGAYDFNTGDPVKDQVDFFLESVKPDDKTLMALDFEDNVHSNMSLEMARDYLDYADKQLGRRFWIYTGNRFKDLIARSDDDDLATFFGQHRLWLCEYGPQAKLIDANGNPLPWDKATLWQFSGDGIANRGITVPGLYRGNTVDMNTFDGTDDDLAAIWS